MKTKSNLSLSRRFWLWIMEIFKEPDYEDGTWDRIVNPFPADPGEQYMYIKKCDK